MNKKILLVITLSLFAVVERNALASPLHLKVTKQNKERFIRIKDLNRMGVEGGCYARNQKRVWIGNFHERTFFPWQTPKLRQLGKSGYRRTVKKALKRCRSLLRAKAFGGFVKAPPAPHGTPPTQLQRKTPTPWPTQVSKVTATPTVVATQPAKATATKKSGTPIPQGTPTRAPTPTRGVVARNLVAIPLLAEWESHMLQFGKKHCSFLQQGIAGAEELLNGTYYDAQWVYQQIEDYTKDASWEACARAARAIYRDKYVLPNQGKVPGYWNFTHGLSQDFLRTGNTSSKQAAVLLSQQAAYAGDGTPLDWTLPVGLSRETAYAILSYLHVEDIGGAVRTRRNALVDQALGHLRQWFINKPQINVRSFMVGLTTQALIEYAERHPDPRVLQTLIPSLDRLWELNWVESAQSMRYQTVPDLGEGNDPSPDLNLLIAPAYAWVYRETGLERFRDRGDKLFAGGVRYSYIQNPKQFNQSYRWSFDYVKWRKVLPKAQ